MSTCLDVLVVVVRKGKEGASFFPLIRFLPLPIPLYACTLARVVVFVYRSSYIYVCLSALLVHFFFCAASVLPAILASNPLSWLNSVRAFRASVLNEVYAADAAEQKAKREKEEKERKEREKINPFSVRPAFARPALTRSEVLYSVTDQFLYWMIIDRLQTE
jgi:hypothetical protein